MVGSMDGRVNGWMEMKAQHDMKCNLLFGHCVLLGLGCGCMVGSMDGQVNGRMDGWMDGGRRHQAANTKMFGFIISCLWFGVWMHSWMDGWPSE